MMNLRWFFCYLLLAFAPQAWTDEETLPSGLSDQIVATPAEYSDVRDRLENQVDRGGESVSSLSTQSYTDSQARMAETFRRPIPDWLRKRSGDE